jgi:hypothetical protein
MGFGKGIRVVPKGISLWLKFAPKYWRLKVTPPQGILETPLFVDGLGRGDSKKIGHRPLRPLG